MSDFADKYPNLATDSLRLVGWVWLVGIGLAGLAAVGFGIYYVLFLILGAVLLITCPCIGLGVIGATLGVWGTLLIVAAGITIYTASIATAFAMLLPLVLFFQRDSRTVALIVATFLFHCLVGFYLIRTGAVNIVFSSPSFESISNVINGRQTPSKKLSSNNTIDKVGTIQVGLTRAELAFEDPYIADLIKRTVKTDAEISDIKKHFEVSFPVQRDGDFVYGSGCRTGSCSSSEGYFFVNIAANDLVIITFDQFNNDVSLISFSRDGQFLTQQNGKFFIDRKVPSSLVGWFSEKGIKIDNPNVSKVYSYAN